MVSSNYRYIYHKPVKRWSISANEVGAMKLQNAPIVVLQILNGIISFGSVPQPLDPCPEIHCKQDMVGLSAMRMTSSFWIRWVAKSSACGVPKSARNTEHFFLWGNAAPAVVPCQVYDLSEFMDRHPGGPTTILAPASAVQLDTQLGSTRKTYMYIYIYIVGIFY